MIDGLIASAARHLRRSIVLSSFYRGELPELRRLSIGPDLVFGRLGAETGCCVACLPTAAFLFDVARAVYLTVLHRLMISGSDRHASDWRDRLRVAGADGLDLDHAYKAMAWLGAADGGGRATAEAVEEGSTGIASRCSVGFELLELEIEPWLRAVQNNLPPDDNSRPQSRC